MILRSGRIRVDTATNMLYQGIDMSMMGYTPFLRASRKWAGGPRPGEMPAVQQP